MSVEVDNIISKAEEQAFRSRHEFITPEHLLYASLSSKKFIDIFKFCNIDTMLILMLEQQLDKYFLKLKLVNDTIKPVETLAYKNVISRALSEKEVSGKDHVELSDILVSLFDEEKSNSSYLLRKVGLNRLKLLQAVSAVFPARGTEKCRSKDGKIKEVRNNDLEPFATDLTLLARENKLDPVLHRDNEIKRLIQTLCRRTKNNPVIVGDPGVGKTALAEGLALRIAEEKVPSMLKDFIVYSLNIGMLIAGTEYRGEFEENLSIIIDSINNKSAILFIDEIHTLIGTGAVGTSSLDVANILKPHLARGSLRCIGATTYEEYKKVFEKDKALSRRFQRIEVNEPSEADAISILNGLKSRYENYHNVIYDQEAIDAAVHLSARYVNDRRLPDKAIDIIDEAGSNAKIEAEAAHLITPITIDKSLIESIVSNIAHIPEISVSQNEQEKLKNLSLKLKKNIFGQDEAIKAVVNAIKRSKAGFRTEGKPVANFLFAGPTGVGKTELARQLAENLGIPFIRYDMSEYQEKYNVSRFIGSSPGYIGYEEGGQLTEDINRNRHAVVLLDEIEKAHPEIFNILLQIMDYATLTDGKGRKTDFQNVILIMTSNAGASKIGKSLIGFGERILDKSTVNDAINSIFTPEFRNRLDAVIRFEHLSNEIMVSIVQKELDIFSLQLARKNVFISVTDACIKKLVEESYNREFGARNVNRFIEDKIKTFFVDEVLFGCLMNGGNVNIDWQNGEYLFKLVNK